jgi:hypothetical protein
MKYRIGEILKVKKDSEFFYHIPWLSFKFPYCKIYGIIKIENRNYYYIGSLNKNLYDYWGNIYVSDFEIKYYFSSLKQERKIKLRQLYGRV